MTNTLPQAEHPQITPPPVPTLGRTKVAYLASRFPKLTETFVLYEIQAVEQQGTEVEVYPLLGPGHIHAQGDAVSIWRKLLDLGRRAASPVMHPEARVWAARAHYQPFFSRAILSAQWHFLRHHPRAYLGALAALVRGTWGSQNYLLGGLAIFPKTAYLARLMQARGITHVHAHFANHPAAAAFVIHRLTGIPYSFTAHGADLHCDQQMLRQKVAAARFVVPISDYNRRLIVEHCGRAADDRLVVIHCGVDTGLFAPREQEPAARPFRILSVGTLYEVKGQAYLIEACRELSQRGLDFQCQIVGDGPDRQSLACQIRQAGLEDRVHLLGWRPRQEVVELFAQTHVTVAPSVPCRSGRREGIPVVLMEAMACGVAVVASRLSGIPELVQDQCSGWLVPPRDAAALADALQRLHDDPGLRRRLGQAGRDRVVRHFDLHTNAGALARRFSREVSS